VITAATLAGMLMNFAGINPIAALYWSAVVNGLLAPPLLVLIMIVANNREVLGERVNGRGANVMGWLTAAVMSAAAVALIFTWGR
jgi:Mn2+/Fe2+ NRAMP family transporter